VYAAWLNKGAEIVAGDRRHRCLLAK